MKRGKLKIKVIGGQKEIADNVRDLLEEVMTNALGEWKQLKLR
ncbi:MAG: hypothetical protein WD491_13820 [Balneolales bacterium]